jgi:hypothetical protein
MRTSFNDVCTETYPLSCANARDVTFPSIPVPLPCEGKKRVFWRLAPSTKLLYVPKNRLSLSMAVC